MRNVNHTGQKKLVYDTNRFILTMRNVNTIMGGKGFMPSPVLY